MAAGTESEGKVSVAVTLGARVTAPPAARPVKTSVPSETVMRDAAGSSTNGEPPPFRTSRVTSIVCPGRVWLGDVERATNRRAAGGLAWSVSAARLCARAAPSSTPNTSSVEGASPGEAGEPSGPPENVRSTDWPAFSVGAAPSARVTVTGAPKRSVVAGSTVNATSPVFRSVSETGRACPALTVPGESEPATTARSA